jgi:large subunit ribosomal protein L22
MQFIAKARYINFSPYKLRPLVDVVRGKDAQYALNWLSTVSVKRVEPLTKVLKSAVANAKQASADIEVGDLTIKDIRVDQGPILKYFKPGAMGRANIQRRRFSHISVTLEAKKVEAKKAEQNVKPKTVKKRKEA